MKNLNFIASARHNTEKMKRDARVMMIIMLTLAGVAVIARCLYTFAYDEFVTTNGVTEIKKIGWPVFLCTWACRFLGAFFLFYLFGRFRQDLKKPSLGVTADGIFINQQILRNAFVPWDNISAAELQGTPENTSMKITFKDSRALLKGQPFMLKSIAKANLDDKIIRFSKDETIGDIGKMYNLIQDKIASSPDGNFGGINTVEGYDLKYDIERQIGGGTDNRTFKQEI